MLKLSTRYGMIMLCLGALMGILVVFVAIYAERVGEKISYGIIEEFVEKETEGAYSITYGEIDLDILNRKIVLSDVKFLPDPGALDSLIETSNAYTVHIAYLKIDLKSILKVYTHRELAIDGLRIGEPVLHIDGNKRDAASTKFSLETGNLYNIISDYLNVLQIETFAIEKGQVYYKPANFFVNNIDLEVDNFLVKENESPEQVLYSKDIRLSVRNQSFYLGDSLHRISFDNLFLSTEDSILLFKNIQFTPNRKKYSSGDYQDTTNMYAISVPALKMVGIDYAKIYQKNDLQIDEFLIDDASIFIKTSKLGKNSPVTVNSLVQSFTEIFDTLSVAKFAMENTMLDVELLGRQNYRVMEISETDVNLYDILLHAESQRGKYRLDFFKHAVFDIRNYSFLFADSVHKLTIDRIALSTFDSLLNVYDLSVTYDSALNKNRALVTVNVPEVEITGIHYLQAWVEKGLNVSSLRIIDPEVIVKQRQRKINKVSPLEVKDVYAAIEPVFGDIISETIEVRNGMFRLEDQAVLSTLDFVGSDLELNAQSARWYDLLNVNKLAVKDFEYYGDEIVLKAAKLNIDEDFNELYSTKMVVNNKICHPCHIDSLSLYGLALDSILIQQNLIFDSAYAFNPVLSLQIHSTGSDQTSDKIHFSKLRIDSGKVIASIDGEMILSAKNETIEVSKRDRWSIQLLGMSSLLMTDSASDHSARIASANLQHGRLSLSDVSVRPIADHTGAVYNITVPSLEVTGFDPDRLIQHSQLAAQELVITRPDISVNHVTDSAENSMNTFSFNLGTTEIIDGNLAFTRAKKGDQTTLHIPSWRATCQDISYAKGSFESGDMTLHAKDVKAFLPGNRQMLMTSLYYSKDDKLLQVKEVRNYGLGNESKFYFPETLVYNFSIDDFVSHGRVVADSVMLRSPELTINVTSTDTTAMEAVSLPFQETSIGKLEVSQAQVVVSDSANKSYAVQGLNTVLTDIHFTKSLERKRLLEHIGAFSMRAQNFTQPVDNDYVLYVKDYTFEYPAGSFLATDVKLHPLYDPLEYSKEIIFQKDWFDVAIDSFQVSKVDLNYFLKHNSLHVKSIGLSGVNINVFRDKRVPFPEHQRRALPQKILADIGIPIKVDSITFQGNVRYSEMPESGDLAARIEFEDLDATILQVSTRDTLSELPMVLTATGKLMGEGEFDVNVTFDMSDPDHRFDFRGVVKPMNLKSMNQLIEPLADVTIGSGRIHKETSFHFVGNNNYSSGDMRLRYKNLKLVITSDDSSGFANGLKTFIANAFIIRNNNPQLIFLREGDIYYERDIKRSIFNFWGKSLMSGAAESVGIQVN